MIRPLTSMHNMDNGYSLIETKRRDCIEQLWLPNIALASTKVGSFSFHLNGIVSDLKLLIQDAQMFCFTENLMSFARFFSPSNGSVQPLLQTSCSPYVVHWVRTALGDVNFFAGYIRCGDAVVLCGGHATCRAQEFLRNDQWEISQWGASLIVGVTSEPGFLGIGNTLLP